jgi:amidase
MKRTLVTIVGAAAVAGSLLSLPLEAQQKNGAGAARLDLVEATVQQIQHALQTRLITSEQLVEMYLARIAAYDDAGPTLNALLHVNTRAAAEARQLDALRHPGRARSPLYGIPVLLKDNIDTADMPTTAGSVALEGSVPPDDAFITRKLREAGAIIIGKATLTEFANFIAIGMPSGYSSLGGYGLNPYEPRTIIDGRPVMTPGGSSSGSGIGVSANFAAVAIGTETSGSILSPASANMDVGIKPTVGLVSRDGIIPITADQDTAGPITRTVTDAAILLGVIAGFDPNDAATAACLTPGNCFSDYTRFLDKKALKGARIAVPPFADARAPVMRPAMAALRAQGAYVEEIPALPPQTGICVARPAPADTCSTVLLYGQKKDLNAYLAATPGAPMRTIEEVVAFNAATMPPNGGKYGQAIFEAAASLDVSPGSADTLRYLADRAADLAASRGALDDVYDGPDNIAGTADDFDSILLSANTGVGTPAKAGYPSITVPGGFLPAVEPITEPTPSGVTFSGPAFSEPRLIALAYAFEQATKHRVAPASVPPLASDRVTRR